MLLSGVDLMLTTTSLNACPRCRRSLPKGPRKLPHPGFSNTKEKEDDMVKKVAVKVPHCAGSCCCVQENSLVFEKQEETFNE